MRYAAFASFGLVAACVNAPDSAPIQFKTPLANEQPVDGVDLSILCELAAKVGTDYRAEDVDETAAEALEDQYGSLSYLNADGVQCGRDVIDLAFVVDPQSHMVSTWGETRNSEQVGQWGSCLADPSRQPGDRVIYCQVQVQDGVALEAATSIETSEIMELSAPESPDELALETPHSTTKID